MKTKNNFWMTFGALIILLVIGGCYDSEIDMQPSKKNSLDDVDPILDSDNDGVPDVEDKFPFDPNEDEDTDGDGTGDNEDGDDDGDGIADVDEKLRGSDPLKRDTDEDGVPDGEDVFPNDPSEWSYTDGDGIGDNTDDDIDGDGVLNEADVFPTDPSEWVDTDGDGLGNNADKDDDGDGIIDAKEREIGSDPLSADSDNDSFADPVDAFPTDPTEWLDTDGDGIGNNTDVDDDSDGLTDTDEVVATTDPLDADTDGDGVKDGDDFFPKDETESADNDFDGIGDNADPDDDNDGLTDAEEIALGSNPMSSDSDGDGIDDGADAFPTDPLKKDPELTISSPVPAVGNSSSVFVYQLTYVGADTADLRVSDVSLTESGVSCAGGISVVNGTTTTPEVRVSGCTGDGTVLINVAAGRSSLGAFTDLGGSSVAATVDNIPPNASIGAPSVPLVNSAAVVTFELTYDEIPNSLTSSSISVLGTNAGCAVSVRDSATLTPEIDVVGCTGDGSFQVSLSGGTSEDAAGNLDAGAGASGPVTVDNTPPTVSIGTPSASLMKAADTVTFTLSYEVAPTALVPGDITVNGNNTDCSVNIVGPATTSPDVQVSGCSDDGWVTISVASGESVDAAGNLDAGAGPSDSVTLDNTAPTVSIGSPSVTDASAAVPVTFELTYDVAPSGLVAGDITVNGDAGGCLVAIADAATLTPDVSVSSCSDVGSITISLAGGRSSDTAGNTDTGAGPSSSVAVNQDDDSDGLVNAEDPFPADGSIAEPMITVWQTTTDNETITLPLVSGFEYDFDIDWGDGSPVEQVTAFDDPDITHTYGLSGTYTVTITGKCEAWSFNDGGDKDKIIRVDDLGATGWKNLDYFVRGALNLTHFSGGDTRSVTSMNATFKRAEALTFIDVTSWNTANVTNMAGFFEEAYGISDLDLSSFDTSNVQTMHFMFDFAYGTGTSSLTSLNISNFNTSNVTNMDSMFKGASLLPDVSFPTTFNTANVQNMEDMFQLTSSLTSLDLSQFNTSNVVSMSKMFDNADSITSLDLSSFDTSNVTSMENMFYQMDQLEEVDLSSFNTSNVSTLRNMFRFYDYTNGSPNALTALNLSNFDFSNVSDMTHTFSHLYSLTSLELPSSIDSSKVLSMQGSFSQLRSLSELNISTLDTSNTTTFSHMFHRSSGLTSLDLSSFNTSNVQDMSNMFERTESLVGLDLKNFETANVTNMASMFDFNDGGTDPTALTTLDISSFNISNVLSLEALFRDARLLSDLLMPTNINTSNVTNLSATFDNVDSLQSIDVSSFDTSNVVTMMRMFAGSNLMFDPSQFNTSNVTSLRQMFRGADGVINLRLDNYNTSNVETVSEIFSLSDNLSYINLMGWNISNVTDSTDAFLNTPALGTTPNKNVACDQGGSEGTGTIFGENCISVPTQPTVSIGAPSVTVINSAGTASFTLTYDVVPSSLDATDITVAGDSADCSVLIIDAATLTPDVEVSGCSSDGSISISLAGGTSNISGRIDDGAGPSGAVTIDNTAPTVSIGTPSVTEASASTPVIFELTYEETPSDLVPADITVNGDNAGCSVGISDAATLTPDVTVSKCSAVGSITITLAVGRSSDAAGNADVGAGPSSSVSVNPDGDGDGLANPDDPFPNDPSIAEPMITVWQTTTDNETITLPLGNSYLHDFTVDWGDSSSSEVTSWDDPDRTHTYATAGTYTVTISGKLEKFSFAGVGDKDKLLEVIDFGATGVKSMWESFEGASNLHSFAGGKTPQLHLAAEAFESTPSLTALDFSTWDTSNVTNFARFLKNADGLVNIDVSPLDTSAALTMTEMFSDMDKIESLDLSSFNTSNVTSMKLMFDFDDGGLELTALTSLDISSFDFSNVQDMSWMFHEARTLANLVMPASINSSNVTTMQRTFEELETLTALDLSEFDTENVQRMDRLFYGSQNLAFDVGSFNTSNVTTMQETFRLARTPQNLNLSGFNTSNVTNMSSMFDNADNLTSLNLSSFDTSNVLNMYRMFYGMDSLQQTDLSSVSTSNVTSFVQMFDFKDDANTSPTSLTALDISSFDFSSATSLALMFRYAKDLSKILFPLNPNSNNVHSMHQMFEGDISLTSLDMSAFNTSNVTNMSRMFMESQSITSLDVSSFDTANVSDMAYMFDKTNNLESLNLANFNTTNVSTMVQMFDHYNDPISSSSALTSLDISNFDLSNTTDIGYMFRYQCH